MPQRSAWLLLVFDCAVVQSTILQYAEITRSLSYAFASSYSTPLNTSKLAWPHEGIHAVRDLDQTLPYIIYVFVKTF